MDFKNKINLDYNEALKAKDKSKIFPCSAVLKQWKKPFSSLIVKDGVFSVLKGESPTNSFPLFFKLIDFETAWETLNLVFISSKYSFGYFINFYYFPNISFNKDPALEKSKVSE